MGRCNLTHLTQHVPLICHGIAMENQHPTAPRGPRSDALPRRALQHGATHPEDEFRAQAPTIRSSWFNML
jgi:hypothetical protein